MSLPADIDTLSLIAKLVAAAGLFVTGLVLLLQAALARRPARRVSARASGDRKSTGITRRPSTTVAAPSPRLGPGSELRRLADIMDGARSRLDTVTTTQRAAARHLDSAEIALNRLLAEIADIMPPAIAPTVIPRRAAVTSIRAGSAIAA